MSCLEGLNIYGVGCGIRLSNVEIQIVKVHLRIEGLLRSTSRTLGVKGLRGTHLVEFHLT